MKKKVVVTSIDIRVFIRELESLIKLGATFTEGCRAIKRPTVSAELLIDETVPVKENAWVKVVPVDRSEEEKVEIKAPVAKKATKTRATKTATKTTTKSTKTDKEENKAEEVKEE